MFSLRRLCVAARAEGQGYASEKTGFGANHVHSGTDLVGSPVIEMSPLRGYSGLTSAVAIATFRLSFGQIF